MIGECKVLKLRSYPTFQFNTLHSPVIFVYVFNIYKKQKGRFVFTKTIEDMLNI